MTARDGERSVSVPTYARLGTLLAGKYRIERVVGSGGMGIVVAASHVALRQTVAIKFLLPNSRGELQLATRLLREARAAAALKGEHVARVFDVDVVEGAPYIVMEYLEGQTLTSVLRAGGPLSPTLTVDYALEACEALAEAHALGIVHRDLKPSNLFLSRGPGGRQTLRVLDFGISKALEADNGELTFADSGEPDEAGGRKTSATTDSHALVGSPPYVSPEQLMRPRQVDIRSDIWSLGVVLYQCLSGRLPFEGDTLRELWDSILRRPAPPFTSAEAAIPAELAAVVHRCLEKESARRFSSVRELARALVPFGSARGRSSLEVIDGLAFDAAQLVGVTRPSFEDEQRGSEQDATLTEAPTTRERTQDAALERIPPTGFRPRMIALAVVGSALLGGALLASRSHGVQPLAAPHVPNVTQAPDAGPRKAEAFVENHASEPASVAPPVPPTPRVEKPTVESKPRVAARASATHPSASASAAAPPTGGGNLSRAEELLGKGQIAEACAAGQVLAETSPDSPAVSEFLGRCYMRLGLADQARVYYRRYLELAPTAPNAPFVRAMLEPKPP